MIEKERRDKKKKNIAIIGSSKRDSFLSSSLFFPIFFSVPMNFFFSFLVCSPLDIIFSFLSKSFRVPLVDEEQKFSANRKLREPSGSKFEPVYFPGIIHFPRNNIP